MEEMNRSNDQGLGLLFDYIMMFFVCTVFSLQKSSRCVSNDCFCLTQPGFASAKTTAASATTVFSLCRPDSFLSKQPLRKQRLSCFRGATRIRTGGIKVLQTFALPLGYGTIKMER